MGSITPEMFNAMEMRLRKPQRASHPDAVERESDLHQQIVDWAKAQWSRVMLIRARMDKMSTIAVGAHDITAFLPGGKVMCIECKSKGSKLRPEQLAWKLEMERLGHTVHVVYSFAEFQAALASIQTC